MYIMVSFFECFVFILDPSQNILLSVDAVKHSMRSFSTMGF